jgi:hypothetical protein
MLSIAKQNRDGTDYDLGSPTIELQVNHLTDVHKKIVFKVTISSLRCRNLPRSDCYAAIQFDNIPLMKTTIQKNENNPKWDNKFEFMYEVAGGIAALVSKKLVCKIYSVNNLVRDAVIGSCEINLAEISCGPVHQDQKLVDSRGGDTGRFQCNCQISEFDKWGIDLKTVVIHLDDTTLEELKILQPNKTNYGFKLRYA